MDFVTVGSEIAVSFASAVTVTFSARGAAPFIMGSSCYIKIMQEE